MELSRPVVVQHYGHLTLTLDFKVKFWKCCISGMEEPIDMEIKGCESIGCYTNFVTFNVPLTHDLDLVQILKKSYLRNGMADWHGIKV